MVKPLVPLFFFIYKKKRGSEETAGLLNELISEVAGTAEGSSAQPEADGRRQGPCQQYLAVESGLSSADAKRLSDTFPQVKRGAVISAVDLINGIGYYAVLRRIAGGRGDGPYDTNDENKVAAALEALRTDDFVYLHIEASDEAGARR